MIVCFIMVVSTIYAVGSYEEVYDLEKIDNTNIVESAKKTGNQRVFNEDSFGKWKSEYEHPLVIGNVTRKARTLGVEVKTVNDW